MSAERGKPLKLVACSRCDGKHAADELVGSLCPDCRIADRELGEAALG